MRQTREHLPGLRSTKYVFRTKFRRPPLDSRAWSWLQHTRINIAFRFLSVSSYSARLWKRRLFHQIEDTGLVSVSRDVIHNRVLVYYIIVTIFHRITGFC